jgi:hypothetical protein
VLVLVVALIAAGHAGYYLRGFVDEWRMRGVLRRVHATLNAQEDHAR